MNKLWSIDDVDDDGNLGLTMLLAPDKKAARKKFREIHKGFLKILTIEQVGWSSFSMWDHKINGATGYLKRVKVL